MTKPPKYWKKAISYLSSKDRIMRNLIKKYDDTFLTTRRDVFFFFMQKYYRSTN